MWLIDINDMGVAQLWFSGCLKTGHCRAKNSSPAKNSNLCKNMQYTTVYMLHSNSMFFDTVEGRPGCLE